VKSEKRRKREMEQTCAQSFMNIKINNYQNKKLREKKGRIGNCKTTQLFLPAPIIQMDAKSDCQSRLAKKKERLSIQEDSLGLEGENLIHFKPKKSNSVAE
jgi:hypothetical protein